VEQVRFKSGMEERGKLSTGRYQILKRVCVCVCVCGVCLCVKIKWYSRTVLYPN